MTGQCTKKVELECFMSFVWKNADSLGKVHLVISTSRILFIKILLVE